jgi:flagellin-specific chaperone FliS
MEINEKEKSSSAEEVRKSDVTTDNETTAKKESDSDAGDTPDIPVTDEKQAGTEVTEIEQAQEVIPEEEAEKTTEISASAEEKVLDSAEQNTEDSLSEADQPVEQGKASEIIENPAASKESTDVEPEIEIASKEQGSASADLQKDDPEESGDGDDDEDGEEQHEEEHHLDYSNYSKKQLVQVLESLLKEDDFSQVGRILKEIKKPFDELTHQERKEAYDKYIEDGGEKDGFEYREDELDRRFNEAYNKLRDRKNEYYNSLETRKEQNLNTKLEILEKLRELVDSEETGASIKDLKELQVQWKAVGPVPSSQLKSLWANYNALLDRFYDNRSIYFELKELDRKKNFDLKIELCEKAELLTEQENIREVIKHLNELHEEFKHIGPVPQDDQEAVWERFKAASDKIYSKRKDYYEQLKEELKVNQAGKEALVEKVLQFADFDSEKISDWNNKTKEIIAIQKEWEAIGSLPKEKAKKINKQFWSSFKGFFNKKGLFFKKIEEVRKENLKLKQELVDKADALKDSDDFRNISEELKNLQKRWKEIGPVPEKYRNEIFLKFKKACDHFFNRRRANNEVAEKEYEVNLKAKQALCDEMEKMVKSEKVDIERVKSIEAEWAQIGYVPRSNIKSIQKRYTEVIEKITGMMDLSEQEVQKLRFKAQFNNMNFGPGSERLIQKKEGALRRQITNLENDVNLWKNNIDFFAASKNADKLKKDFQVKIDKANEQLQSLKDQLKMLNNI